MLTQKEINHGDLITSGRGSCLGLVSRLPWFGEQERFSSGNKSGVKTWEASARCRSQRIHVQGEGNRKCKGPGVKWLERNA